MQTHLILTFENFGAFELLTGTLIYLIASYATKARTLSFLSRLLGSFIIAFALVAVGTWLWNGHYFMFVPKLSNTHNLLLEILLIIMSALIGGLLLLPTNSDPELDTATLQYYKIVDRFENIAFDAVGDEWSDDDLRAACRLSVAQIEEILGSGPMYNIENMLDEPDKRIYTVCLQHELYYVSLTVTRVPDSEPGYEKWEFVAIELRQKKPTGLETIENYIMDDILSDNN